ncbi:MAG TPA: serine/threonine-protein kinase [Gemmatimonadales bacterium]|nr:serine/threonine-protein kinase [Gemmatimonadales bacterium]
MSPRSFGRRTSGGESASTTTVPVNGSHAGRVPLPSQSSLKAALRGRYEIHREVGHGGMATVYLARDVGHDRAVALKVMRSDLVLTLGPQRFRREIRLAARLQHPHILTVLDSGEAAGQPWFTMPFVEGETLRDRLRREGALPIAEALRITREAAQALAYAHHHGVVHRDVKPENLLLTQDGSTLLADFGVALPTALLGEEHFTETGLSLGTPAYVAPEQATGSQAVDGRSDQYALAATCYEMLVGKPPFTGPTAAALIAKRFSTPVPAVRAARAEVPRAVDQALRRALALNRDERFGSIESFIAALEGAGSRPRGRGIPALAWTMALAARVALGLLPRIA